MNVERFFSVGRFHCLEVMEETQIVGEVDELPVVQYHEHALLGLHHILVISIAGPHLCQVLVISGHRLRLVLLSQRGGTLVVAEDVWDECLAIASCGLILVMAELFRCI